MPRERRSQLRFGRAGLRLVVALAALGLQSVIAESASGHAFGGYEFVVNTYTYRSQDSPAVGVSDNGFLVIWSGSNPKRTALHGTRGRNFDARGRPISAEFLVTDDSVRDDRIEVAATIDRLSTGEFVVVWESYYSFYDSDVRGKIIDATGTLTGTEFPISNRASNRRRTPRVSSLPDGGFAVVWIEELGGEIGAGEPSVAHLTLGNVTDPQSRTDFVISPGGTYVQSASLAVSPAGSITIAIDESAGIESPGDILVYVFDGSGALLASPVNLTDSPANDSHPKVGSRGDGTVVVVWQTRDMSGDGNDVYLATIAADGELTNGPTKVHAENSANRMDPDVAVDRRGEFLVVWSAGPAFGTDDSPDGDGLGVFGRFFDATAAPRGAEFQINAFTTGDQGGPGARPLTARFISSGDAVVIWSSQEQDGDDNGIVGRIVCDPGGAARSCGDPTCTVVNGDQMVTSNVRTSDALFVLATAVGIETCELCVCDADDSGAIAGVDALAILRAALGLPSALNCPSCGGS